ncbi:uncharacterized protein [Euphorbia lathyris]|uniref:uncharacterized protein n=1 Tax=Euphorbia lathyris TaxID=212925 RepID=UPI00331328BB
MANMSTSNGSGSRLTVEIRWKGPKFALSSFRRTVKRNFTKEVEVSVEENDAVEWDEEFQNLCTLSPQKENVFHPWEIAFTVFNGANRGPMNKVPTIGTVFLNLAEYASTAEPKELELRLPLSLHSGSLEPQVFLCISLSLLELRTAPEEPIQRAIVPDSSPPHSAETVSPEKDELSAIKAGLRKVKIFTEYVPTRRAKKSCRFNYWKDCLAAMNGTY